MHNYRVQYVARLHVNFFERKKKGFNTSRRGGGMPCAHQIQNILSRGCIPSKKKKNVRQIQNALPYGGANEVKKEEKCPVRSTGINLVVYYIILYYYGFFSLSSLLIGRNFSGRFNHFLLLILFKRSHNYFPLLHLSTIWHILKTDGGTICLVVSTRFFK